MKGLVKTILTIIAVSAIVACVSLFAIGCGGKGDKGDKGDDSGHTHVYDKEVTTEKYLATAATCTEKATYYYSCACGEKGTQTFSSGDSLGHKFGEWQTMGGKRIRKCTRTGCDYVGGESQGLEYEVNRNDTTCCTIAGIGTCTDTDITIPEKIDGYKVTTIDQQAFAACYELTSITIPNGVTSIRQQAFVYCDGLISIVIPDSVRFIGFQAFYNCSGLTSVTIGNGLNDIDREVFGNCSGLESITVSSDNAKYHSNGNCLIETESKELIFGCKNSVIPNDGSVTSIGESAFIGCIRLTSIAIPGSVTNIPGCAFEYCGILTNIIVDKSNKKYHSEGNCLIETETKTLVLGGKNCVIPSDGSVTSIGDKAFYGRTQLDSIVIPDGVTSIGNYAFMQSGLATITIPDSITSIGDYAFLHCNILHFGLNYNEYDNALYLGNESNPYVALIEAKTTDIASCIINENCKVIANSAFV